MLRVEQNFEKVFSQRLAAMTAGDVSVGADVYAMEKAIQSVFSDMNSFFARQQLHPLAFCGLPEREPRRFLARFDSIFTLNQDLLLELHYEGPRHDEPGRRTGYSLPGINLTSEWKSAMRAEHRVTLPPLIPSGESEVPEGTQPVFKLHGSANWRTARSAHLMIVGTGKEDAIAGSELLNWYHAEFRSRLCGGGVKLMVIGYGFGDVHVNVVMLEAARSHGLSVYLVNPSGLAAYDAHKRNAGNGRNELLSIPLVGISTRPLAATFGPAEDPSFASFWRFLDDDAGPPSIAPREQ
jgi:hypothetical protein